MRTNWEWEQFGEDIRRTVQDAVDSRDFRRLNQTITDTVNSAFHEFTDGMRNPRGGYQYQKADYGTGRQKDRTKGAWQNLDLNQLKRPTLYAGTRDEKSSRTDDDDHRLYDCRMSFDRRTDHRCDRDAAWSGSRCIRRT